LNSRGGGNRRLAPLMIIYFEKICGREVVLPLPGREKQYGLSQHY
jgi:hypothetical protein